MTDRDTAELARQLRNARRALHRAMEDRTQANREINKAEEQIRTTEKRLVELGEIGDQHCSACGVSDLDCWHKHVKGPKQKACCSTCRTEATHGQNEPGYVDPWSLPTEEKTG